MPRFRIYRHNGLWRVDDQLRRTVRSYLTWQQAARVVRARLAIRPTKET